MKRSILALALAVAPAFNGCSCGGEPAPEDVNALALFFWDRFDPSTTDIATQESEIRAAVLQLDEEFKKLEVDYEAPFTGVLEDIDRARIEDFEGVGDKADNIELAQGFMLANLSKCSQQQNINMVMSNIGVEVHPDAYAAYDKRFDGDADAFARGEADFITWTTDYRIDQSPVVYDATIRGNARRIRGLEGEFPRDIFITRVNLLEADFDGDGDDSRFELDFQLEVYFERDNGDLAHFYVMWRRMVIGIVDNSNEIYIGTTLDGFVDWELENDEACESGLVDG